MDHKLWGWEGENCKFLDGLKARSIKNSYLHSSKVKLAACMKQCEKGGEGCIQVGITSQSWKEHPVPSWPHWGAVGGKKKKHLPSATFTVITIAIHGESTQIS